MAKGNRAARTVSAVSRTIRFPKRLRDRVGADAERCGRSFEAQVLAVLKHHYGESVDIAPTPGFVLALARASLAGVPEADRRALTQKLRLAAALTTPSRLAP